MSAVLRIDIVSNSRDAQAGIDRTDSALSKLGGGAKKAGALVAGGLAVAGGAAIVLGKQAFDAASAVQQSFGALDSVFGKFSTNMKDLANGAANSVGLSKSEYASLAVVLGSQLKNMGRSQQEAANQTENLIKMGADLAATYGGSVADAVSAVSSALKGETDPIERYGASVKQSDINARLAAQGLDKLTGTAAKQAQANAVLAAITEQTTSAQGAFGREANTAAGQQERLSANVENLKAKLGAGLLPVMTAAFGFLNTQALPAALALGASLQSNLGPSIRNVGAFITGSLVPALRSLVAWFMEKIVPNIRAYVVPIITQLRASFGGLANTLDNNSGNLEKLAKFVGIVIQGISKLLPIVGKVIVVNLKLMSGAISGVISVISTLVGWIDSAISKVTALANAIKNSPIGKVGGAIGGAIGGLFSAGGLAGGVGRLVTRQAPSGGVGTLATASAMGGGVTYSASGSPFGARPVGLVDARTSVSITVAGAIDPVGTAEQIRRLLRGDDVRLGRAATFAPATGWSG